MFEDLKKKLEYTIEIGVFQDKSERERSKKAPVKGVTNAELMYIHEYGSPIRHIPARPVLGMTVDYAHKILPEFTKKAVGIYLKSGREQLEKQIKIFGVRLADYAKDIIYRNDGTLQENAPATVRIKGFNHPLFETSQLARSISSRVLNDKGDTI